MPEGRIGLEEGLGDSPQVNVFSYEVMLLKTLTKLDSKLWFYE